jgi:hypothetical protein
MAVAPELRVDFCGESMVVDHQPFTIGRDADLVVDGHNRHLHRRLLAVTRDVDVWLLANTGARLTASVADPEGRLDAYLAPGAVLPIVLADTVVRFTAGPTTYELTLHVDRPLFAAPAIDDGAGDTTMGEITLTPDQLRLVLVLAEPALEGAGRSAAMLPSSSQAARRLGWTTRKFNRKLDHVCHKLAATGVRGLRGDLGQLASNRRARLVEYALGTRLVTRDDLVLLDGRA